MLLDELVNKYDAHEVDFVLPNIDGDTPVYLDLFLLYQSPDQRWHEVQSLIYEYFNIYLKKYRNGKISEDELINALIFPEVPFIALGYCKNGFRGSGGAKDRGRAIKEKIFDNETILKIGIGAIAEMSIAVESIGPDILSDMAANFAMHHLIDYTNEQVKTFNLKTAEYQIRRALDIDTMEWRPLLKVNLPYFKNGEPRILVPKHLVRKLPIFSTMGFYHEFLRFVLKQEEEDRLESIYKTIGRKPRVFLKTIKEKLKSKYGSLSVAARSLAKDRPELIEKYVVNPKKYENFKRTRRKKESIDWDFYIESLKNMPAGRENARDYADLLRRIFVAVYGNSLINGKLEKRSLDDFLYYDISFANAAITPLFGTIRNQGIKSGLLLIEAKNYDKTDLSNKEFSQSLSYSIPAGRELVFLITRNEISERNIKRSRRFFLSHKILILPLSDKDIISMIKSRKKNKLTFDGSLVRRVQKILEA